MENKRRLSFTPDSLIQSTFTLATRIPGPNEWMVLYDSQTEEHVKHGRSATYVPRV